MAEEVNKHVETIFSIRDLATKPLQVIGHGAEKLSEKINHASEILGDIAGIAGVVGGALGFKSAVEGAEEYIGTIKKVSDITGLAAERADGLVSFFSKAGVSAEETSHAILMMSKAGVRMEATMMGVHQSAFGTTAIMRQMGIDINKGPEAGLMKMAKLAHDGRLNTAQLMQMFRVAPETAVKMIRALKQGPEAMRETIDELRKRGIGVTEKDIASYTKMLDAQNSIKESWERIKVVVGKELFPVLSTLLKDGSEKLESWIGYAKQFGKMMGGFLRDHLSTIIRISKVLLLNATLVKATDKGVFDWAKKGAGMFSNAVGGKAGIGVAFKTALTTGAASRAEFLAMSRIGSASPYAMGGAQKVVTQIVAGFLQLRPMLSLIGRLSLVTTIIVMIVEGFMAIKDNFMGITDFMLEIWEGIKARVSVIADLWSPIANLFSGDGIIGQFFKLALPLAISGLGEVVDGILHLVQTITLVIAKFVKSPAEMFAHPFKAFADSWNEAEDMTQKRIASQRAEDQRRKAADAAAAGAVAPTDRSKVTYDFRNSRFDITQKFAEGFDPDRLAVAFTNDLAALGEQKIMSAYSPAGAV